MITVSGLYPPLLYLTLKRPFPHHPRHSLVIDLPPLAPKLMRHPTVPVPSKLHHNLFNAIPKICFLLLCLPNRSKRSRRRNPNELHIFLPDLTSENVLNGLNDLNVLNHLSFYVVLENPPSTIMISPVTKRLCKIRLSMLSATSSSVQQRLSGVYLARRAISPS